MEKGLVHHIITSSNSHFFNNTDLEQYLGEVVIQCSKVILVTLLSTKKHRWAS